MALVTRHSLATSHEAIPRVFNKMLNLAVYCDAPI